MWWPNSISKYLRGARGGKVDTKTVACERARRGSVVSSRGVMIPLFSAIRIRIGIIAMIKYRILESILGTGIDSSAVEKYIFAGIGIAIRIIKF